MLAPALIVVGVFFVGGLGQAVAQSLGYQPLIGSRHLSLDAYRHMFADTAVRSSVVLTLQIAVISTVLAAVLGVAIAVSIRRLAGRRQWAARLTQVNLAVPHLVGALCIQLLLSQTGLVSRLAYAVGLAGSASGFPALTADRYGLGIMAEYVWKETPFLAMLALAALGGGATELEVAARSLGAGSLQRLRHVILPVVAPSVAAGSVLVFAFAVGSYEVPYLLGRPYPATLPVVAYHYYTAVDLSARSEAMAVAVLISVISLIAALGYVVLLGRIARRSL